MDVKQLREEQERLILEPDKRVIHGILVCDWWRTKQDINAMILSDKKSKLLKGK